MRDTGLDLDLSLQCRSSNAPHLCIIFIQLFLTQLTPLSCLQQDTIYRHYNHTCDLRKPCNLIGALSGQRGKFLPTDLRCDRYTASIDVYKRSVDCLRRGEAHAHWRELGLWQTFTGSHPSAFVFLCLPFGFFFVRSLNT